ncbi:MAG: FeoB-associated Cys-rich membrane protein [Clostridiales bacterium]|nr:FeoB-associated Cys-rich membrane protein [Clostridiales bacterium]
MAWLTDNLGTIIISLILLVVVGLVIYKMISDKRKGKSSCGCNCGSCPSSSICHSRKSQDDSSKSKPE